MGFHHRVYAAWAVLRGRPVVRGVDIFHGEVSMRHRDDLLLSDGTIQDCDIWTRGPVALRADKTSTIGHNSGNALIDGDGK